MGCIFCDIFSINFSHVWRFPSKWSENSLNPQQQQPLQCSRTLQSSKSLSTPYVHESSSTANGTFGFTKLKSPSKSSRYAFLLGRCPRVSKSKRFKRGHKEIIGQVTSSSRHITKLPRLNFYAQRKSDSNNVQRHELKKWFICAGGWRGVGGVHFGGLFPPNESTPWAGFWTHSSFKRRVSMWATQLRRRDTERHERKPERKMYRRK